jgi:hypothetical protein
MIVVLVDIGTTTGGELGSCRNCGTGKYSTITGATTCQSCPAGTYSLLQIATECTNCPAGRYSDTTANTLLSDCINCPIGKYYGETGGTSSGVCESCGIGTYGTTAGATSHNTVLSVLLVHIMPQQLVKLCLHVLNVYQVLIVVKRVKVKLLHV